MNVSELCILVKKNKTEVNRELRELFQITQPAVWAWDKKTIPANRLFSIFKYYKLNPQILLKNN
ncbi:MAG: hypothetical protein II453_16445 [Alphaproteobacteria bacterium]|jgi:hypothetical protein|nr:hypothetical protein [Alphaproteobacteria bacterium]